jgi:DNA-binding XRE family transcriptional regulator
MKVSTNLKRLRQEKTHYSQQDVADQLGIKQSTYCNWESGKSDMGSDYLPQIAQLFGISISDLYGKSSENLMVINQSKNKDNAQGHGIVLNISDEKTGEKLVELIKQLAVTIDK